MSTVKYSNQLEYVAAGPLDKKNQPVDNVEKLNEIPKRERYPGMTVTVMNDGTGIQSEYWLVGADGYSGVWEKKTTSAEISIGGDDVEK